MKMIKQRAKSIHKTRKSVKGNTCALNFGWDSYAAFEG